MRHPTRKSGQKFYSAFAGEQTRALLETMKGLWVYSAGETTCINLPRVDTVALTLRSVPEVTTFVWLRGY